MLDFTYKEILGIVAIIMTIYQNYLYIHSIIKGKTKPHLYSYLIWFLLMGMGFVGQYLDNGGPGIWSIGLGAFFALIIVLFSLKHGTKDINNFDKILLGFSLLTLLIYFIIQDLYFAIALVIIIDLIGYIPTMRKTFNDPDSEDLNTRVIMTLKFIIVIIALDHYTFLTYGYVLMMIVMNSLLIGIIIYRRKILKLQDND